MRAAAPSRAAAISSGVVSIIGWLAQLPVPDFEERTSQIPEERSATDSSRNTMLETACPATLQSRRILRLPPFVVNSVTLSASSRKRDTKMPDCCSKD